MNSRPHASTEPNQIALGFIVGSQLAALLPIPAAIAMTIAVPNYMLHMVSAAGLIIGAFTLALTCAGYALARYGARFFRKRQFTVGWLVVGSSLFLCTFPAVWLIFLGPALVAFISR